LLHLFSDSLSNATPFLPATMFEAARRWLWWRSFEANTTHQINKINNDTTTKSTMTPTNTTSTIQQGQVHPNDAMIQR